MTNEPSSGEGLDPIEAVVGELPWRWDLCRGLLLHDGAPAVSFWLNPSLWSMLYPLREEVGDELFRLLVADSGTRGAQWDYEQIVSRYGESLEDGIAAWAKMVAGSGWGRISLLSMDMDACLAKVRVDNPWELRMGQNGECWGCPFLQGKIVGIFTKAFGVTCWADETIQSEEDHLSVEFEVAPSEKTIPLEIAALRQRRMQDSEIQLAEQVRAKTEEVHRIQEEQRSVLASLSDLIVVTDLKGVIRQYYVPLAGEDCFPAREGALGRPASALFGVEIERALLPSPGREVESVVELACEVRGRMRHYDCRLSPLRRKDDARDGWTLAIRDITARRVLEQGLQHRTRIEAIGHLSDGIAHDFNNFLMTIAGSAEMIQIGDGSTSQELSEAILEATSSASSLVERMLDFSRKSEAAYQPVDVHAVIAETLTLLGRRRDTHVLFEADLQAEDVWIEGDPTQLQSAFMNLAINARDAMSNGGLVLFRTRNEDLDVDSLPNDLVGTPGSGTYLVCSVHDAGEGMTEEVRAKIFEPFFTTKESGSGTGLGLTSVAGTVLGHGAAIAVESRPGEGSVFTMYLPLERPADPAGHEVAPEMEVEDKTSKGRVLFVEDDELVRGVGSRLLALLGYEVVAAVDGQDALKQYEGAPGSIDVILLDLMMPVLGGAETLQKLRQLGCQQPILVTSGGSPSKSVIAAADGILTKPYSMESLAKALTQVMGPR